jgi:adenosine deaminase
LQFCGAERLGLGVRIVDVIIGKSGDEQHGRLTEFVHDRRVTLDTNNRLMSNNSMTRELTQCADAFGWNLDNFQWLTVNAVKSAFTHFDERLKIINDVVKPRYAALRASSNVK